MHTEFGETKRLPQVLTRENEIEKRNGPGAFALESWRRERGCGRTDGPLCAPKAKRVLVCESSQCVHVLTQTVRTVRTDGADGRCGRVRTVRTDGADGCGRCERTVRMDADGCRRTERTEGADGCRRTLRMGADGCMVQTDGRCGRTHALSPDLKHHQVQEIGSAPS